MSGDVQQLAATVAELRTRTNEITGQVKDARKRLEILQAVIPEAVATADATLTQQLRAERQDLECVVRDAEGSERVLARKLEVAVHFLAKAELPTARHQAEEARDRLEKTAAQIKVDAQAFLNASRSFSHTRNRAREDGARLPGDDVRLQSRVAVEIVNLLNDGFGVV